jgi:DNA polymerase
LSTHAASLWTLESELDFVGPKVVVALGATAVLAPAGKPLPIIRNRGRHEFGVQAGFITVHPAYLPRLPAADRAQAYRAFVSDLRQVGALAKAA